MSWPKKDKEPCNEMPFFQRRETAMKITRQEFWREVFLAVMNSWDDAEQAAKYADEALAEYDKRFPS